MTIPLVGIWTCRVYICCIYSMYISIQCRGRSYCMQELCSGQASYKLNTVFPFKTVYLLGVRGFTSSSYIVFESQSISRSSFSSHFNVIKNISSCEPAKTILYFHYSPNLAEIIKNVMEGLQRLSQNGLQECFQHLYSCWQKRIVVQGDCL
jgi:hypothetical protein